MPRKKGRGLLGGAWKKIAAVVGVIITAWLVSPAPEVSIIVGVLSGKTLERFVPP